jgi:hypothetical protein
MSFQPYDLANILGLLNITMINDKANIENFKCKIISSRNKLRFNRTSSVPIDYILTTIKILNSFNI